MTCSYIRIKNVERENGIISKPGVHLGSSLSMALVCVCVRVRVRVCVCVHVRVYICVCVCRDWPSRPCSCHTKVNSTESHNQFKSYRTMLVGSEI